MEEKSSLHESPFCADRSQLGLLVECTIDILKPKFVLPRAESGKSESPYLDCTKSLGVGLKHAIGWRAKVVDFSHSSVQSSGTGPLQTFYAPHVDLLLARLWDSQAVCAHCSLPRCQYIQGRNLRKEQRAYGPCYLI